MEINNYQNQLFNVIDRSYLLDGTSGLPVEKGIMPLNYTKKVELLSYGNNPYERYNQLDNITHIGTFGKSNSQASKLPEPVINCTPRENITASRFNYAFDKCIDRKLVDVSGQNIPNNMLRVIPNRGVPLCYQKQYIPDNKQIQDLSNRIGNISATKLDKGFIISKGDLNFKASRQRLSKEELQGLENLQITQSVSINDDIQNLINKSLTTSSPPVNTPQKKPRRASAETREARLSAADTPKKFQDTFPLFSAAKKTPNKIEDLKPRRGRPLGSRNKKGRKSDIDDIIEI